MTYKTCMMLLCLCILFGVEASAQDRGIQPQSERPIYFPYLVKIGGWDVPGANEGKLINKTVVPGPEGTSINRTLFRLERDLPLEVPYFFYYAGDGTLNIQPRQYLVDTLEKYDIEGQVFCYDVGTKRLEALGAANIFWYCDRDGDGKFEWFSYGLRQGERLPDIPSWVLKPKALPEAS